MKPEDYTEVYCGELPDGSRRSLSFRDRDELRLLFAQAQADARRAALEEALASIRPLAFDGDANTHPRIAYAIAIDDAAVALKTLLITRPATPPATCPCCARPVAVEDGEPRCSSCAEAGVPVDPAERVAWDADLRASAMRRERGR